MDGWLAGRSKDNYDVSLCMSMLIHQAVQHKHDSFVRIRIDSIAYESVAMQWERSKAGVHCIVSERQGRILFTVAV